MEPFGQAIREHLELKERNSRLEGEMPLARYRADDLLANHAVFTSEAQAQQETTSSESDPDHVPFAEPDAGLGLDGPDELWVARGFDWGD